MLDRQPVLEGRLVRLRPLHEGDFDGLYAIASDPLLWEQHPSKDRTERPVFEEWFAKALASRGALTAMDPHDDRIIGTSRFDRYEPARREVELGWTFVERSLWGKGVNPEMKQLMLDHAFRSVDVVVLKVHELNFRSQRAVENLGAVRVSAERDPFGRGENLVFHLERTDFEARRSGTAVV